MKTCQHAINDPGPKLKISLYKRLWGKHLQELEAEAYARWRKILKRPVQPQNQTRMTYRRMFCRNARQKWIGRKGSDHKDKVLMVDAALFAIREIMEQYPEAVLWPGCRDAGWAGFSVKPPHWLNSSATTAFLTQPYKEAYIIGSTVGMSAVGAKPIVEVQFADYIYPGLNQLVTEISKSCYLSCGKFPVQTLIRVPIGAYGGGGPYHSGSVESTLLSIKGIKVVYPSNAADMKGLLKAAFLDPNPVVMLEHQRPLLSKVPGTEDAKGRTFVWLHHSAG